MMTDWSRVWLCRRYSIKVVKAAAQVLNTLWQYRDLRTIYKKVSQRVTCNLDMLSAFCMHLHINTCASTYTGPLEGTRLC